MMTNIVKWGNSQGVRLPKVLLDNVNFSENDVVEILTENNTIIIKKAQIQKDRKSIQQRLEEFYGEDIETILERSDRSTAAPEEIDWGKSEGREIW